METTQQQFKLWQRLKKRLIAFLIMTVVALFLLGGRVFEIQVLHGEEYYEKSQRVIRKVVPMVSPRGEFFSRYYENRENAEYIVSNTTTLNLIAIPSHFDSPAELRELAAKLEKTFNYPAGQITSNITEVRIRQNQEIVLIENLSQKEHTLLADYYLTFSKFIVQQTTRRHYEKGPMMAHITGYIGPPTRADIKKGIRSYQKVGKNGLEAYYDSILRGEDGEIVQIKTARGEVEEQKVFKNFIPGNNLVLTIDTDLQQAAHRSMKGKRGAMVALHPYSGEILALVSKPDYDPNILISSDQQKRREHLKKIISEKAELNRAISTKYPPASTFKPLVALAALEENRITPGKKYNCDGKFVLESTYKGLPDTTFHDWNTFGWLNMREAIAHSCSVYFYELGYKIGASPIIKYARYFMLDKKTQIDLPGEINGFIPSPLWKQREQNMRWFDGDTVNLSIGQGFIETTLIGMVNLYAALVTGGVVYKPHLVKEIRFAENDQIKNRIEPEVLYELPISKSTLEVIREGMRRVATTGTARWVFRDRNLIPVAGKTGTVQTRSDDRFANYSQHAWFIGYGPFDGAPDKTIVVGVFVEKGRGGSVGAAPVAREVFRVWSKKVKSGVTL